MDLLERTPQLTELTGLLYQAGTGQGRLVLLGGEAGAGKTALVRAFITSASPPRLLAGSCDPLSTPRPLGPLLDIAASTGPELANLVATAAPLHRLFGAFLAQLDQAPAPTLAVIEDVHWADEATLDLLRFLGRRLAATHGLVIATYRDDEVGPNHPLRVVLGDLATATAVQRMAVAPLSLGGVKTLAAGSPFDPGALFERTSGNPFFVTEILAAGGAGIPATVRDAVLARANRLSAAGRAVLEAAAIIGSPIEPWLLARVAAPTAEALDECIATGMLRWDADTLVFRHELAREAMLSTITPPRQVDKHARVLAALRTGSSSNLARLAHHAEAAGDRSAVLAYAPAAAARAAALRSHREAAAQYARALRFADELPPSERGRLLVALSYEDYLIGETTDGIAAAQEALDIWRETDDRLRQGDTLRRLSRLYWFSGRNPEARETARSAIDVLEALPVGPELARAYSNWSQLCMLAYDTEEAIEWGRKAIDLAERFGETETLVHALLNVGAAGLIDDVNDEQARETCERSLGLARQNDLADDAARAFAGLASSFGEAYDYRRADGYLAEGIAYCTEHDLDHMRSYLSAWQAMSKTFQGHWDDAAETAHFVLRQPGLAPVSRIVALVALGRVRARRGEPEALFALDEALELATQTGELQRLAPVRAARAEAAWLAGDLEGVRAEAQPCLAEALSRNLPWLADELAYWLWRAGAFDQPLAEPSTPFALQIAGRWREATRRWQALGCPYEEAWALADAGDESHVRLAHASFLNLGAAPAAAIVARRLRRMGVRGVARGPRPRTRANPANLTKRELEILALLAEGLPNAGIAGRLYLSPRTVAHHVSALMAKFGVHSRTEAVQEATRLGIVQNGHLSKPN